MNNTSKKEDYDWKAKAIEAVTKAMGHGFTGAEGAKFVQMILEHK